MVKHLRI